MARIQNNVFMFYLLFFVIFLISLLLRNDTNTLVLPDLGKLRQVRILHDNSGSTPSWFLEKVQENIYSCCNL